MTASAASAVMDSQPSFISSFKKGLRKNWLYYLIFIFLVMAIAAFWVSINSNAQAREQNVRLERAVECQNNYNQINNERTRRLAVVTDKERSAEAAADTALFRLTDALARNETSQVVAQRVSTLQEKLSLQEVARREGNKEREEHPVPPPPAALCGTK